MLLPPSLREHYLPLAASQHDLSVGHVLFTDIHTTSTSQLFALNNDMPSSMLFDNLLSTLDVSQHPTATIIASYCLVTASDMIPFVPCQPLAIALGAKLGPIAFPITALGQTTAGVLAFTASRRLSNSIIMEEGEMEIMISNAKLSPEAIQKLQDFRILTSVEEQGDMKILLALIGLRLAPFFPFSAGNYLLGGTTSVPLRLFVLATLFGCVLSNFVSVSLGTGGAMFLHKI